MAVRRTEETRRSVERGNLVSLLYKMELAGLLEREEKTVGGKIRTDYRTTEKGNEVLMKAKEKAYALFKEIKD